MSDLIKKREGWIDLAKGIGIVSVVLHHSCASLYRSGMYTEEYIEQIINCIICFHMPLFFMLSGYVFSMSYLEKRIDGKRRAYIHIANLTVVYVFFSFIRYLFKIMFHDYVNTQISYWSIFLIIFIAFDELWFLYSIILITVVSMLIYSVKYERFMWPMYVLLCVVSIMYYILGKTTVYTLSNTIQYSCFFIIGQLIRKCRVAEFGLNEIKKYLMVMSVLIIICIGLLRLNNSEILNNIIVFSLGLLIPFFIMSTSYLITMNNGRIAKHLQMIGRHSLEIYLIHVYIISFIRALISRLELKCSSILIIAICVVAIYLPIVIVWILKKIGLYKLMFKPLTVFSNGRC